MIFYVNVSNAMDSSSNIPNKMNVKYDGNEKKTANGMM